MRSKFLFSLLYSILFASVFTACNEKSKSEMDEVHWDRDTCARCVMVVSDRHNTVQVKNPETGKSYMFDDIGCMAIWFEDEKIQWKNNALVWITDLKSGEWIDAKKAYYDTQNITPMSYGYSAHKTKESIKDTQEVLGYDEVLQRILKTAK
ncbi:hypothetical protein KJ877_06750 [bacterium]|nr:hypothetical protein [bacterium]MBU1991341.1 hypothetical protein [bacterium]